MRVTTGPKAVPSAALIFVLLCSAPRTALANVPAEEDTFGEGLGAAMGVMFILFIGDLGIMGGGLAGAIGNGIKAGRGERPGGGWQATGYIFGPLNLVIGTITMAIVAHSPSSLLALPGVQLSLGATCLGMTIWGSTKPEKPLRVAVAPLLTEDAAGRAAYGLGLQLAGW